MSPLRPLKIILLGEGRCGKTSILLRWAKNEFSESQAPTSTASFLEKRIQIDGESVILSIWDTAGQEKYHSLGPIFYRDADAAIIVFDQSEPSTLEKVEVWRKELRAMVEEDIPIVVAGNKIDLSRHSMPEPELLKTVTDYAESVGVKVFWTSALLNKEIEPMFLCITREIIARLREAAGASSDDPAAPNPNRLELTAPAKPDVNIEENCC